jgi:dienelactone hydrolase
VKPLRDVCVVLVLCLAFAGATQGRLVEEQISVPVRVSNGFGKEVAHEIVVTVFRDDRAAPPYPLLILNHGRAGTPEERSALGRARYGVPSRWLTRLGFMVAVPTRVGYGVTGGEDVEDTGLCSRKNYPPGFTASAVEALAVLELLRRRADVAPDRAVVMGQSFGGATAIAVAALAPAGVQLAVNFAGGGGGDPKTRPQDPCAPALLKKLFADYGRTARMPTLWIYTENDMYFGPRLPEEWFEAFKAAGGNGQYLRFPARGESGHNLFSAAPEVWQPTVLEFLRANGYPGALLPEEK